MQLKKHIKRANHRQQPCRHCGGQHQTGQHDQATQPQEEPEDYEDEE